MPTILTHAVSAACLGPVVLPEESPRRLRLAGPILAVLPDLDGLGYLAGIPYEHMFGHRGITHSLTFAALAAGLAYLLTSTASWSASLRWRAGLYLLLCAASHGILDGFTDGGLGIAFLAPFSEHRFFFPFQPIRVAPLRLVPFFSRWGARALASELVWVWLPGLALAALATLGRRMASRPGVS